MSAAKEMLAACRSTLTLADCVEDEEHRLALRISVRAMLKGVGAALRNDGLERDSADAVYHAYLGWRADRDGNAIFWNFINVDDCATSEASECHLGLESHMEAVAWWERQLVDLNIGERRTPEELQRQALRGGA